MYKVTTICDGIVEEQVVTRQERDRLDPSDVDVHIDETKRTVFIAPYSDGNGARNGPREASGFGAYVWDFLTELVFAAGERLPLESNASTNTRIRRLRRAFGDSKTRQWFFITTSMPYEASINTDRSWRIIERLAQ
jgi:hypothetical protein